MKVENIAEEVFGDGMPVRKIISSCRVGDFLPFSSLECRLFFSLDSMERGRIECKVVLNAPTFR